mmetsp:Transcript_103989/g.282510  ORF Transcript_103989/g.282510 Transcript_103989/m.282510 type:complete len:396 (+) Transcript_103989:219-1406(+)
MGPRLLLLLPPGLSSGSRGSWSSPCRRSARFSRSTAANRSLITLSFSFKFRVEPAENGRPAASMSSPSCSRSKRTCSSCLALSASRYRMRSTSCRSPAAASTLCGPSLAEPFSQVAAMLFCLSCRTIWACRSSCSCSSAFSRRSSSTPPGGPARSGSQPPPPAPAGCGPPRPSCRLSAATKASSLSLFRSRSWTLAFRSRSWTIRLSLRDFMASRFRFPSAWSDRRRSTSSCNFSKSSRLLSAAWERACRSFSAAASALPARRCCGGEPARGSSLSGSSAAAPCRLACSLSSRTWRCSCEIWAARPLKFTALGSSATLRAFSTTSSDPSSFSSTLRCRWMVALSSWALCLTSCSSLEAVRYFFFHSSMSPPMPSTRSSACFFASSRGFRTSASSC